MKIFPIKFKTGSLELAAIVSCSQDQQRFKIELVTGEPGPILLRLNEEGIWIIENPGERSISVEGFHELQKAIEKYLKENV